MIRSPIPVISLNKNEYSEEIIFKSLINCCASFVYGESLPQVRTRYPTAVFDVLMSTLLSSNGSYNSPSFDVKSKKILKRRNNGSLKVVSEKMFLVSDEAFLDNNAGEPPLSDKASVPSAPPNEVFSPNPIESLNLSTKNMIKLFI